MNKILKGCLLLFFCSICGIFSAVVAQPAEPAGATHTEDGRAFKVYAVCKAVWNADQGQWIIRFGWFSNSDFPITSTIENGIANWNLIGYHPDISMSAGTYEDTFAVILIDANGYPLPSDKNITWTVTDYAGNVSTTYGNMSLPTCRPKIRTPEPTSTDLPVIAHVGRPCPAWATYSDTGLKVCLWDLPYAPN